MSTTTTTSSVVGAGAVAADTFASELRDAEVVSGTPAEEEARRSSVYDSAYVARGEKVFDFNPSDFATNCDFQAAERMDDFDWPDEAGTGTADGHSLAAAFFRGVGEVFRQISAPLRGVLLPHSEDDRRAQVLPAGVSVAGIAEKIRTGGIRKIVVMAGAGLSTAAGIPDFRSPGQGLYHRLMEYDIPRPEAVLTLQFFRQNPKPFFHFIKTMYPGGVLATKSHYFLKLLADKGLLARVFTQNIDMLERQVGIDPELLVEAHGTFASAHCTACGIEVREEDIRNATFEDRVPHCHVPECRGVVKPDIVFFDEQLPLRFFQQRDADFAEADLLIVIGTSLTVEPFASCIAKVDRYTPRLLINQQVVGRGKWSASDHFAFGEAGNYRDVLMRMAADDGVTELASLLGWGAELEGLVEQGKAEWAMKHPGLPAVMPGPGAGTGTAHSPPPSRGVEAAMVTGRRHGSISVLHTFEDRSPLPLEAFINGVGVVEVEDEGVSGTEVVAEELNLDDNDGGNGCGSVNTPVVPPVSVSASMPVLTSEQAQIQAMANASLSPMPSLE